MLLAFILQDSNRELTSSSDVYTTDNASRSSPINVTPISLPPVNAQLLSSPPKPVPVHEPLTVVSTQTLLTAASPIGVASPDPVPKIDSPELRFTQKKTRSPLPTITHEPKLPTFSTFDKDDDPLEGNKIDLKRFNNLVNRPPNNPFKNFSRASTSPVLSEKHYIPSPRKGSAPIVFNQKSKAVPRSSLVQTLTVDTLSRRKSLSEQDISQLVEKEENKERRTSRGGYSSDSELRPSNSEARHDSDLQSSTGACGLGSDMSSGSISSEEKNLSVRKGKLTKSMLLSAQSVDVIETRLRERGLKLG